MALTFANHESNAEYQMLTAFREGKDYDGIREALEKNPEYASKTENVFLFPDEVSYKASITEVIKILLNVDLKIRDQDGKIVNIDERHNFPRAQELLAGISCAHHRQANSTIQVLEVVWCGIGISQSVLEGRTIF